MTTSNLSLSFSNDTDINISDPYWLRMEVESDSNNQMTVAQAAQTIDSLFNTSVCNTPAPVQKPTQSTNIIPTPVDWGVALSNLNLITCTASSNLTSDNAGAYDVRLRIYRSHKYELYKLVFSNGSASSPSMMTEYVTKVVTFDGDTSYTVDKPIIRSLFAEWQGLSGPDITVNGNTLSWAVPVHGALRLQYYTRYDLITVHVTGTYTPPTIITGTNSISQWMGTGWYSGSETGKELTDIQDTECTVLAFYHYQYEEMTLHKPSTDESLSVSQVNSICLDAHNASMSMITDSGTTSTSDSSDGSSGTMSGTSESSRLGDREPTSTEHICICSGETSGGGSSKAELSYEMCGDPEDVSKSWYYEEHCCKPVPDNMTLPLCKKTYGPFSGASIDSEKIMASYGDNAVLITVGAKEGGCGETITTQDVPSGNCCNQIPAIENNISDDSIADGGIVRIKGGKPPYTFKLSSSNFHFGNGEQEIEIDVPSAVEDPALKLWVASASVTWDGNPCADASVKVTVNDECSTFNHSMSSESGYVEMKPPLGRVVVAPGTDVGISFSGGTGPYTWDDSQFITFDVTETAGTTNIGTVDPALCGNTSVTVTDDCNRSVTIVLNSTDGKYVPYNCYDGYCCDNAQYGGDCLQAEGTMDYGYGVTGPSNVGYSGKYKGSFGVDNCAFLNGACGNGDSWCSTIPDRCPALGGALSFECGENRGSRNHGICGMMEAYEASYIAAWDAQPHIKETGTYCDGVVYAIHEWLDYYGDPYDVCNVYNLSLWGGISIWEC